MHHIRIRFEPAEPFDVDRYVAALVELAEELVRHEQVNAAEPSRVEAASKRTVEGRDEK